jgi:hypothetical protein
MDTKIEQWQEIISRWRESGQTQKDFCRTPEYVNIDFAFFEIS